MSLSDRDWPRCACGCGEPVPARKANCTSRGYVKGEPCKYVAGHSNRVRWKLPVDGKLRCPKCATDKPVEQFQVDKRRPSGRESWCAECAAAKRREWHQENRERRRRMARLQPSSQPEYQRENVARWRERNYDRHLAQARVYAAARRARRRDQFVEHVEAFVVYDRDSGMCGICGLPVERTDFHVDHIVPLARGGEHSYANVQAAHPLCNASKRDRILEAV
jgi:5-methylcytosine-specific restriction endonuclease McrA